MQEVWQRLHEALVRPFGSSPPSFHGHGAASVYTENAISRAVVSRREHACAQMGTLGQEAITNDPM
jgi:hypothetical protein